MSYHHYIATTLDLKDKNITFPEDWIKEVHIRRVIFKLCSHYPYKEVFNHCLRNIQ